MRAVFKLKRSKEGLRKCLLQLLSGFDSTGWKKHFIEVQYGGACFFHLTVNLAENKFEDFRTNGYG